MKTINERSGLASAGLSKAISFLGAGAPIHETVLTLLIFFFGNIAFVLASVGFGARAALLKDLPDESQGRFIEATAVGLEYASAGGCRFQTEERAVQQVVLRYRIKGEPLAATVCFAAHFAESGQLS